MEDEELDKSQREKKLEREIKILRYQNDRLLQYLRANKYFYKKRLQDKKQLVQSLTKQLEDATTENIIRSRKDEDISN